MAVNRHGVTVADILSRLPLAKGSVTETSAGLTTGHIESWIDQAAGVLNSVVSSHGIDVDHLQPNETMLMVQGICAYAEWKSLAAREYPDGPVERARQEWQDTREIIRQYARDFESDAPARRIRSGVGRGKKRAEWSNKNFGGW